MKYLLLAISITLLSLISCKKEKQSDLIPDPLPGRGYKRIFTQNGSNTTYYQFIDFNEFPVAIASFFEVANGDSIKSSGDIAFYYSYPDASNIIRLKLVSDTNTIYPVTYLDSVITIPSVTSTLQYIRYK